jgi:Rieske 2Fe-2S family protein
MTTHTDPPTTAADSATRPARVTLPGRDYRDPEIYALERERIFFRSWFYAGRAERIAEPGQYFTVDVAGESVIVVRDDDGGLNGFYNVCRHRGSQLCDNDSGQVKGTFMCPYHAWCYDLKGSLVATPRVTADEVPRDSLSLWPVHVDEWQGFVYVNLDRGEPQPLRSCLGEQNSDLLDFERFDLGALRVARTTENTVAANWKIVIENYCECLHCPTVHPELVEAIPAYKTGWVFEPDRVDGGVSLATGFSYTGYEASTLTPMPTMTADEATSVYGSTVFPNMFLDIAGSGAIATCLIPQGPAQTRVVTEYLFQPADIEREGFDPQPVLDFSELVAGQDYVVCERVQRGVSSRAFDHGVYPAKDEYVHLFNQRYLAACDQH